MLRTDERRGTGTEICWIELCYLGSGEEITPLAVGLRAFILACLSKRGGDPNLLAIFF
jgi:hypothetical protein